MIMHPTILNMLIKTGLTEKELRLKIEAMTPEEWDRFQLEYAPLDKKDIEKPN